eukprot:82227_1
MWRRIIQLCLFTVASNQAALVLADEDNMDHMNTIQRTSISDVEGESQEIFAHPFGTLDERILGEEQLVPQMSMSMPYDFPEESTYSGKKGKGTRHQTRDYTSPRTGKKETKKGENKYLSTEANNWGR